MNITKGFASDNYAGVHPEILQALVDANQGHMGAYGNDPYTKEAELLLKKFFGDQVESFFVYNGTGANVLAFQAMTMPFQSIICGDIAHVQNDECGAPERFTGCKLLAVPTINGKLTIDTIAPHVYGFGDQHHAQPKVISITQVTEVGTVYTPNEIKALADYAHEHDMLLHMDGARLANAAASLNCTLKEITFDAGVDVLSFGGTKNGMMFGEVLIFKDSSLCTNMPYIRKQGMQLASKSRFISSQFIALLTHDLWLRNASHANAMAQKLLSKIESLPDIIIQYPVQANGIFTTIPVQITSTLQEKYFFYVMNEQTNTVRWMCSFDTTEEDIDNFFDIINQLLK